MDVGRLDSSVGNPGCEEKAGERRFVFSRQSEDDRLWLNLCTFLRMTSHW